jgi:sodium/pantothenate symporter
MSTVAGNSNGAALIISYDFIRYLKKNASDSSLRKAGRISIIVIVVLSYLCSLRTLESVTILIHLSNTFFLIALYPIVGIFIWKRATVPGCLSGMIGGFIATCVTNFYIRNPLGIVAGGWGLAVGIPLFVVVSFLTKPISAAQREEFLRPLKEAKSLPQTVVE